LAGVGDRKRVDLHFRVTDAEGLRFMALCGRLDAAQTDVCRSAVLAYLEIVASAPPELSGPHLAVYVLDRIRASLEPAPKPRRKT
jgi:hypothetical protein